MTRFDQLTENFSALSYDTMSGGDLEGIDSLLPDVISEVKRLESASQTAFEDFDNLVGVKRERTAELAEVQQKRNENYVAHIQEGVSCPAADIGSLAMQDLPLERKADLLQSIVDCIDYILSPAAMDTKLGTRRDLLRAQHLEAGLYAARSHCTMLQKLEYAGLSQTHGRVVAFSETTQRLKLITAEFHRQAQLADAELTVYRAAQLARTAQRHANCQITRIEAVYSELSRISTTTESNRK